jgi:hypothetical protein
LRNDVLLSVVSTRAASSNKLRSMVHSSSLIWHHVLFATDTGSSNL